MRQLCVVLGLLSFTLSSTLAQSVFRVLDDRGEPAVGAVASLTALDTARLTNSSSLQAVADPSGELNFSAAEPGAYELLVRLVGYQVIRREVRVSSAVGSAVELRLAPSATALEAATVIAVRAQANDPFAFVNVDAGPLAEANPGQDVPYLLRRTPGAVVTSDAGTGIGYTGIRIRGADATRINVTINGVPLNDAESQGVYWVNMPDFISSTSSVQVQRGVGQSTYGAGAFGANINLATDAPAATPTLVGELAGGNYGTGRAMLKASSGVLDNGLAFDARASYITSDGYVDRASAELGSAYASVLYTPTDAQRIQLLGWTGHERTYQAWYGIPESFLGDPELRTYNFAGDMGDGEFYEHQEDNYKQTHAQLLYSYQLPSEWLLQLTGHYTRGIGFYEEYRPEDNLSAYYEERSASVIGDAIRRLYLDNHFGGVIATASGRLSRKLDLVVSAGANRYAGDHYGKLISFDGAGGTDANVDPDRKYYDNVGTKTDLNAFAKLNYDLSPALRGYADLQVRYVDYRFQGIDRSGVTLPQDVQLVFFNPKLGLTAALAPGQSAFASFAVGQREPNRNDYVEAPAGQQAKPEQLFDYELGYRFSAKRTSFEATGYFMDYYDQLAVTGELNDVGEATRVNVPRSHRLGLEFAAGQRLAAGFGLEGNLALSRSRVDAFTEYIDNPITEVKDPIQRRDTPLAFSPEVVANLGLTYRTPVDGRENALDLALWGSHVGPQFLDNSGSAATRLAGYQRVDFEARYKLKARANVNATLTLQVQNVLGAHPATKGYSYRFASPGSDPRIDDPSARLEQGDVYVSNGYYPQAGVQLLAGVRLELTGKRTSTQR